MGPKMADPDVGDPAPSFTLPNQDEDPVRLDRFEGDPLVLFFYPGDFTPGCTREACKFRDAFEDLRGLDAHVVGISQDSPSKHAHFRDKYDLPFPLLSDEDGAIAQAYGVDGFLRTRRVTFIIGPDGTIQERIASLLPGSHIKNALKHLEENAPA